MSLKPTLKRVLNQVMERRASLSREEAHDAMQTILTGSASDLELSALLGALAARGETAHELAGFVDALRAAAATLPLTHAERESLVDTCGTGGDLSGTFNISTAAALVAAAAGARVAKHGNRAVTSQCGSADVLEALGVPVDLHGEAAAQALRRHGFVFLHATAHHPALRAAMPVRRALGVRTVFNLIGPLLNPAGARAQVMGVYAPHLVPLIAQTMLLLDIRHAFVVHGEAGIGTGMDELSIAGPSTMAEVRDGSITLSTLTPENLNLPRAPHSQLTGSDAQTNAAILTHIFAGQPGPRRDVVILNAAAVLVTAGIVKTLPEAVRLAEYTVDRGAVTQLVASLQGA